jgi:LAS superfamily LD-carboxypeptidase LdcB
MMKVLFLFLCMILSIANLYGATGDEEFPFSDTDSIEHAQKDQDAPLFFSHLFRALHSENPIWKDDSLERFVSKDISLNAVEYKPEDLESLSGAYINEAGRVSYLRKDALTSLRKMAQAFRKQFQTSLVVVSGYRSAKYQQRRWDLGRCTATLCAPPGYSEHQLGLAVDIFDASTEEAYMSNARLRNYIAWVQKYAHTYGYTQSYQNGPEVDGYDVEPWHWRYVGIPLATKLHHLDMTYSEYVEIEGLLTTWFRD